MLLRHVLGLSRAQLYSERARRLSPSEEGRFWALVERRARHEPVAYLVGHREFYGLDFRVDDHVFIPRPETELLVEQSLAFLRGRGCPATGWRIADVGTGCGAIAISLAVHQPEALVCATDISAEVLEVARENALRHGVSQRVRFRCGDLLAPLAEPVDLLVSNLPYIPRAELARLPKEVIGYEPLLALDGGEDGLAHYRRLLAQAPRWLHKGGAVIYEVGAGQREKALALARSHFPLAKIDLVRDYAGLDRVVRILG